MPFYAEQPDPRSARHSSRFAILAATSLMLFSMFFGAGNLIFPPELGARSGENFAPAFAGFALGAVLLPILGVLAIAVSGTDIRDLANRAGTRFGAVFSAIVYLSIGAFYALPRTGAVSYSTAFTPVTGIDELWASVAFNLAFFGISMWLALSPGSLVDRLGKILTPLLLGLLALLVIMTVFSIKPLDAPAIEEYARHPLAAGLLSGYMTMDSAAALAFAIVVISALRAKGVPTGAPLMRSTVLAGVVSGALLFAIYLGLALVGRVMPQDMEGASMLSSAAEQAMGPWGRVIFGVIVLLACLTTSTGLLAACSEFFERLLPFLGYRGWLTVFTVTSFIIASAGLQTVLDIAAPIIVAIYPVCITVIAAALLNAPVRRVFEARWAFRLPAWAAAAYSFLELLATYIPSVPQGLVSWAPMSAAGFGWVVPTLIAAVLGIAFDLATRRSAQ